MWRVQRATFMTPYRFALLLRTSERHSPSDVIPSPLPHPIIPALAHDVHRHGRGDASAIA